MIKFFMLILLTATLAGCGDSTSQPQQTTDSVAVESPQQTIDRLTSELSDNKIALSNQIKLLDDFKSMYSDTLKTEQANYAVAKAGLDETIKRESIAVAVAQACAWGVALCPDFEHDKQHVSLVAKKTPVLTADGTLGIGEKTYAVNANPYVFYEVIAAKFAAMFAAIAVFIMIVVLSAWLLYEKRAKHVLESLATERAALKAESAVATADKAQSASLKKVITRDKEISDTLATSNKAAQESLDEKNKKLKKIQDDIDKKQRGLDLM